MKNNGLELNQGFILAADWAVAAGYVSDRPKNRFRAWSHRETGMGGTADGSCPESLLTQNEIPEYLQASPKDIFAYLNEIETKSREGNPAKARGCQVHNGQGVTREDPDG